MNYLKMLFLSLHHRGLVILRFLSTPRRTGFLLRLMFCWVLGLFALFTDESSQFDLRFNLRANQKVNSELVVIQLKQNDFSKIFDFRTNSILNINEITDITDSFYWDKKIWKRFLTTLLAYEPKSVLVTLHFGANIGNETLDASEAPLFQDSRIKWTTSMNNLERPSLPLMTLADRSNVGSYEIRRDEDGVVRRIFTSREELSSLIEKVTEKKMPESNGSLMINYRGTRVFPIFSMSEILSDDSLKNYIRGKTIVIGAENSSANQFQTPLGSMSKAEITANILDNLISERWIRKLPFEFYAGYIFLLVLFALMIMGRYPQSVSLTLFFIIAILLSAFSAWCFDSHYIWMPALTPFFTLIMTWVVFVGHRATQIERAHYRLQQEKKYLEELEQLKNNFVSLISHDLKTPIAKIQAVVDRLLTQSAVTETTASLNQDLRALRSYGDELNKYIQSILKVLRVESRDFRLNKEVADLNDLVFEANILLAPLAKEKSLRVELKLEPLFSQEFDVTLMKEVVINLIENAIKYTAHGGQVLISTEEIEDNVKFSVTDTGEGIASEDLVNIWGKFVRGRDQDLKTKGTGLGLYLVKYFIELHGGQVNLVSQVGVGTTVTFTLPLSTDNEE